MLRYKTQNRPGLAAL